MIRNINININIDGDEKSHRAAALGCAVCIRDDANLKHNYDQQYDDCYDGYGYDDHVDDSDDDYEGDDHLHLLQHTWTGCRTRVCGTPTF